MKKIICNVAAILSVTGLFLLTSCPTVQLPDQSYAILLLLPGDGESDVSLSAELTWKLNSATTGASYEYDVYLDQNNPPTTIVATHLSMPSFWPTLKSGTVYYWKVVGQDYSTGKSVTSAQWKFKTVE